MRKVVFFFQMVAGEKSKFGQSIFGDKSTLAGGLTDIAKFPTCRDGFDALTLHQQPSTGTQLPIWGWLINIFKGVEAPLALLGQASECDPLDVQQHGDGSDLGKCGAHAAAPTRDPPRALRRESV